jgi:tRNA pseudouridine13 synthase
MYKLKSKPEDFLVEEEIELKLDDSGDYVYFWLKKKEYTTQRALDRISGFLKCRIRDIGFAGNKDKIAVTKQAVSIKDPSRRIKKDRFEMFSSELVSLEYIGRGKKPISLGDLSGNRFEIILRDCVKEPQKISQFVNYFDEQRFSATNKDVGKAIIDGDLKQACELIKADEVQKHLQEKPNDFVGAMKRLALKTRLLHIHSYQSWLWNETVKRYLEKKHADCARLKYSLGELVFPREHVENISVPIIGFGSDYGSTDKEIIMILQEISHKESIKKRDFVIKQMPELSAEGGVRDMVVDVGELDISKKGEKEYLLRFFLPKGCYATMAVKRMMG